MNSQQYFWAAMTFVAATAFALLAAAFDRMYGQQVRFRYDPSPEVYWQHGRPFEFAQGLHQHLAVILLVDHPVAEPVLFKQAAS